MRFGYPSNSSQLCKYEFFELKCVIFGPSEVGPPKSQAGHSWVKSTLFRVKEDYKWVVFSLIAAKEFFQ